MRVWVEMYLFIEVNVLIPQCANTLSCIDNTVYHIHVYILYLKTCLCIMRKLCLFQSKVHNNGKSTSESSIAYL